MGRQKKVIAAGDPAVDVNNLNGGDVASSNAPLGEDNVSLSVDAKALEGLMDLSTRDLRKAVEFDDERAYFVSIRADAPFAYRTIHGISFERRKGTYDTESHSWSFQPGRVISMSPRLAEVIKAWADQIWILVRS